MGFMELFDPLRTCNLYSLLLAFYLLVVGNRWSKKGFGCLVDARSDLEARAISASSEDGRFRLYQARWCLSAWIKCRVRGRCYDRNKNIYC